MSFVFQSGARYDVPVDYLLLWYEGYRGDHNRELGRPFDSSREPTTATKTRRLRDGHVVRVYLDNGEIYDVAWDMILMACEPAYEHFGGLTEDSKEFISRWFEGGEDLEA